MTESVCYKICLIGSLYSLSDRGKLTHTYIVSDTASRQQKGSGIPLQTEFCCRPSSVSHLGFGFLKESSLLFSENWLFLTLLLQDH